MIPPNPGRVGWLDVLRGAAVIAMVIYHGAWDLDQLRLIETEVIGSRGWGLFARLIAASFLTLSGIGLVLAHGGGLRARAFMKRLALLAGAAGAVTVATMVAFPDSYIFFGILHALAVSSVLALPFLQAPAWAGGVAALAIWSAAAWTAPAIFDAPALAFLGLGHRIPNTNDWVPLVPWAGFVLAGVALARWRRPRGTAALPRSLRPVAVLGRHSLLIYLLHQPLLFGALSGYVELFGADPVAEAAPFLRSCAASCTSTGQDAATCRGGCDCAVTEFRREGLWPNVVANRLGADELARASALARSCLAVPR